jgi:CheY-like chemotaxis protein
MPRFQDPDLFGAVAAAAEGVSRSLRRDPASAVLFWGEPPELEVVHKAGVPEDVCRSLTASGGRYLAQAVRREAHPLRVRTDALPAEARGLATALRAHAIPSLAAFPLFGETGIVGCLVVPLEDEAGPPPPGDAWRAACRALGALQVVAGAAAVRTVLAEDRRRPLALCDGVLVIDRWERVVFADGLVREGPAWRRADPFGRPLNALPGGALLSGIHLSRPGALEWEEHLLPPLEGHGVPVAVAALPGRLLDDQLDGSRVILVRDLSADPGAKVDSTGRMLALGLRLSHAVDELSRAMPAGEDERDETSPLVRGFLREARRAPDAVRELLERTMGEECRDVVDLNQALNGVVDRIRPELEMERVRVFGFLRPDLPAVPGDALVVLRWVRTLVNRARDSLRGGGGTLTVRSWSEEGWVCAAISDDGAGAAPQAVSAFEPLFHEIDALGDDELEAIRAMIQHHGGRLQVERRPRVWNRYTVMLPAERRLLKPVQAVAPEAAVRRGENGTLEVLVVDDNGALRSVLRRFLERRGHRVTEATDGDQALGMVSGRAFDRVIVDIHMPGKSGPEFYDSLAEVAPALRGRTFFMTGGFLEEDTERFIEASGRPAIKKPFDLTELARTVEDVG